MNCTDHRAEVSSIDNAGALIISVVSQARQATSIRFAFIDTFQSMIQFIPILLALILSLGFATLKQFVQATKCRMLIT